MVVVLEDGAAGVTTGGVDILGELCIGVFWLGENIGVLWAGVITAGEDIEPRVGENIGVESTGVESIGVESTGVVNPPCPGTDRAPGLIPRSLSSSFSIHSTKPNSEWMVQQFASPGAWHREQIHDSQSANTPLRHPCPKVCTHERHSARLRASAVPARILVAAAAKIEAVKVRMLSVFMLVVTGNDSRRRKVPVRPCRSYMNDTRKQGMRVLS